MGFSLSMPKWGMWIGVFGGGGKRRGRVRILRTAAGDCGGGIGAQNAHPTRRPSPHHRRSDPNAGPVAHSGRAKLGC